MRTRGIAKGLVLLAVMSLVSCGSDALTPHAPTSNAPWPGAAPEWQESRNPVEAAGLAWSLGSTVHLADATTIATGQDVESFVVAGDGVFFVPSDHKEDSFGFNEADLYFAAPRTDVVATGLKVSSRWFAASPDGRFIATMQMKDRFFRGLQASVKIYDLAEGEVVETEDGMDTDSIDPEFQYAESEIQFVAITDEEVFAYTSQGNYAYDLATGEGRPLADDEEIPGRLLDVLVSPDEEWRIVDTTTRNDQLRGRNGETVVPAPGSKRSFLSWWADETTVVGAAVNGPGGGQKIGPRDSAALMSCVVPTGACEVFEETTGQLVVFEDDFDTRAAEYPDGRG